MAAKRKTINISVTPQQLKQIEKLVKSGEYQSASEVVRDALRSLSDRNAEREARRRELQKLIREGLDALEAGDIRSADQVFSDLEKLDAPTRPTKRRRSA